MSFESILNFIEWNWYVPNTLSQRVADTNSIASAFNFQQKPSAPFIIPTSKAEIAYVISEAAAYGPDTD